jgi:hypothetical protein
MMYDPIQEARAMAADECARRILAARLTVAASSSTIGSWSPDATGLGEGVPGVREAVAAGRISPVGADMQYAKAKVAM